MTARVERIGVLGGTFDPVHIGHLAAAVNVRSELGLDRVLLVVANRPWQKVGSRDVTPAEDRYAVVQAAVGDLEGLEASRIEIDRGGETYTVDTMVELGGAHPGAELFLIVGADVAGELHTWVRPDELRGLCTLAVIARPGFRPPVVDPSWRRVDVEAPALEVSSSDLRARVADGRPIDVLVPPAAVREIRLRGLYARVR
jgi:nicotinate-nucleotide adenylyltransferase